MKQILAILIGFLFLGCNPTNKSKNKDTLKQIKDEQKKSQNFDFDKFKISKAQLGKIKIGMTITEAEMQFSGLYKKTDEAVNFGLGGGSHTYLYFSENELLFGLIPKLETDTLLFIIAAHKKLKTVNGLHPNSTVEELLKIYPEMRVQQDLMNSWEVFQEENNGWNFVFMTDEKTKIGEYSELKHTSKPLRLTTKTDWITIQ
jgi:hypothetical protein